MAHSPITFPDDSQRISIIGSTGSGKTVGALFHLSGRRFDLMPWVIYDFKRDKNIAQIGAYELPLEQLPEEPGIFVYHPLPGDRPLVERQMWAIWQRENTGLLIDEGYMIGRNNEAFRALLTQGRSKNIPMIILSQRPSWMDTFVFTESEFFQVFRMNYKGDRKRIEEHVPHSFERAMPKYHSIYYDVGDDKVTPLSPVPDMDTLRGIFKRRLAGRIRAIR